LPGTNTLAYSTEASATTKTNLYNIDVGANVTKNYRPNLSMFQTT
jgi:hypothetical protein